MLDPQAKGLLGQLKEQSAKDFSEMTVAEARSFMAAFIQLEGASQDVAEVVNLAVPGPDGNQIAIRVYRPQSDGERAVMVYFHGGGFVLGDLEIADKPCRQLANAADAVVVSVDYRLAPEHKAPAAAEDCYAALCWVAEHAGELGGDTSRLAVGGDSAGGNLAAVVALMARDRGGPALGLQLLIYPVADVGGNYPSRIENGEGYLLTQRSMTWFEQHYLAKPQDAENPYVSPTRAADLTGLPRAVVITAGYDPLRDEGNVYADRLRRADVPVLHLENPTMIHGFMWLGGVIDHTAAVYETVGKYARVHLGTLASTD